MDYEAHVKENLKSTVNDRVLDFETSVGLELMAYQLLACRVDFVEHLKLT